jgi:transcriptional antiterminator
MSTEKNQNIPTQIERANTILLDLKPNVTAQDREDAQQELNMGEATVSRYLTGEGKKIETALGLIEFFQRRILERERKLEGAA